MGAYELFHKRQEKLLKTDPDVYVYDTIPEPFRVQFVHIMHDNLGHAGECYGYHQITRVGSAYLQIVRLLRKELGVFILPPTTSDREDSIVELTNFLLNAKPNIFLSAAEIVCTMIAAMVCRYDYRGGNQAKADRAIDEVNHRFRDHALGYEFVGGEIIRIDGQFVHSEVVRPALGLLQSQRFQGAEEEYRSAHQHYRAGRHKEALNDALKSLESVLKTICTNQGWAHSPNDTASKLIKACFENGLIDPFWESYFSGLRATLESGTPTARNRLGGHGQGPVPTVVPEHIAGYVLHMTACAIVFLVRAEQSLSSSSP
jgi:AbiJ N-terminal domain 4